jgi:photosystem II stability/assembly factor-like uncharacterized protein
MPYVLLTGFALNGNALAADENDDPVFQPAMMSALASTTQLTDIAKAGQRLVAVGWRGHIIYSDDAGTSWQQAQSPVGVDLTAVYFPSPTQGWVVGHGGVILHSADGGTTWTKQQDGFTTGKAMADYYQARAEAATGDDQVSAEKLRNDVELNYGTGPEQPWLDIWFENDQHGYVVGTFNLIMETKDGGVTWTPIMEQVDNPETQHLMAITPIDGDLYLASERGTVFHRAHGAERFVAQHTDYVGSFFGVQGVGNTILAYGLRGVVFRSEDKGANWVKVETGSGASLTGSTALKDGRIVLAAQDGSLLVSDAGAKGFTAIKPARSWPFATVQGMPDGQVAVVGTRGVQVEPVPALSD